MSPTATTLRWRVMGSAVEAVLVADAAAFGPLADLARVRLADLEARWSRFVPTSDVSRLNLAGGRPVRVDPSTVVLVTAMVEAWWATAGRYDPTLLPALVDLGFGASWDDPRAVSRVAPGATWRRTPEGIRVDPAASVVQLPAGVTIDAGGIGKGLAADLVVAALLGAGARGALVSVGGDLRAAGTGPAGDAWTVEVADPRTPGGTLARLVLAEGGVATSGTDVRRWRGPAGAVVHHLVDPVTGRPAEGRGTAVVAATVVAGTGAWADALAKAALVDWADAADRLDAARAGACVVTAAGAVLTNAAWARYAADPIGVVTS